jgi:hypothetical protein
MPHLSVTRLRVRSLWLLPGFLWLAVRSKRQAHQAEGCYAADVRREKGVVFWTRTVWRDPATMRAYMTSGAHKIAMRKLQYWCDEASLVHWDAEGRALPEWSEAEQRLKQAGRVSRVRYPSPAHARGETTP